jgi:hypothetical protein
MPNCSVLEHVFARASRVLSRIFRMATDRCNQSGFDPLLTADSVCFMAVNLPRLPVEIRVSPYRCDRTSIASRGGIANNAPVETHQPSNQLKFPPRCHVYH